MNKEEMIANLEEQRASGGGVGGFGNLAYFAIGNPVTDSLVVNAYAKTNATAFQFATRTGFGYGNHTVMGGNFLYNFLYNRKFTEETLGVRNWSSKIIRPFEKIPFLNKSDTLKNFSFNFISSKELEGAGKVVSDFSEKTGLDKTSEIIRTGFGFGKNYDEFFGILKEMGYEYGSQKIESFTKYGVRKTEVIKNSKVIWGSKEFSDNFYNMVLKDASDETVTKLVKAFKKFSQFDDFVDGVTDVGSEVFKKKFASAAAKKFATLTTFEKILSSPLVRIATGAAIALPSSVAIPLTIATTAVGIVASAGQENAVNNFLNSRLYNTNQFDNYTSEEATASIYSASNIRDANLQALYSSYSKINVANRYLNDLAPISSDYSFELDDAETI